MGEEKKTMFKLVVAIDITDVGKIDPRHRCQKLDEDHKKCTGLMQVIKWQDTIYRSQGSMGKLQ